MTIHRMWYVSVGDLSHDKARKYIGEIKEEIKEKYKDEKKYEDYVFGTKGESRMEITETQQ